ncbi:MAG: TonB-dependent receptor [Gammaproteobacteria bacterium]|nr:TonB-dependent receptor [Xanthomonadales bacterium]
MKKTINKGLWASTLFASTLCAAQIIENNETKENEQTQEEVSKMDSVKVWGTTVQSSSVNIDEKYLTMRQADHLSDLLRSIPGVDVGGSHSLNQRINIRGLDDRDLLITIDGAVQNTYMYHHMGNLQIHADILKAVEIEVGTNSVINSGLGGSVKFKTKEAKDLLEYGQTIGVRTQGSFASNDSSGGSITSYGQLSNNVDFLAYYNYVDRSNFTVGGGKILGSDGVVINESGVVKGQAGRTNDGLFKLGIDLSPLQRLEFGIEGYSDKGNYSYRPDMGLATDIAIADGLGLPLVYPTEFLRDTYTINYDLSWGSNSNLVASAYMNKSDLWRDQTSLANVLSGNPKIVEGNALNKGFNILGNSTLSGINENELTYGMEFYDYETEYSRDYQLTSSENASNFAIYLQDKIAITDKLSLTPGIRYDRYSIDSQIVDNDFDEFTYGLSLDYKINENLAFQVSSTEIFKGPELSEIFIGAGLNDIENQLIKAETGYNNQVVLNYNPSEAIHLGMTYYHSKINNYIDESLDTNIGDITLRGYEFFISHQKGNLLALLSYASQDSELNAFADFMNLDNARLDRAIGDSLNLNIDYSFPEKNLDLYWNTQFIADLPEELDTSGSARQKNAYTIHNLSLRWIPQKMIQGMELTFGIDNIFDKSYASHASRTGDSIHPRFGALHLTDYEPGRNIKTTVAYRF